LGGPCSDDFPDNEKSARSSAEDERFNHVPILPGALED